MSTKPRTPAPTGRPLRVLRIDASARRDDSVTRALATRLLQELRRQRTLTITQRDLAQGLPFIDEPWVEANFTDPQARDAGQNAQLRLSDALVAEIQAHDLLVIGAPIYNFSVPAVLKAWIDLVARARLSFRYTEHGPEGLLHDKRAVILIASGGVAIGSEHDYASGYLRHLLGFLGITDVQIVAAERTAADPQGVVERATPSLRSTAQQLAAA